jgi:thioester reductase-like protein
MSAVFLTGATGFLGMELLSRFLERDDRHVYALVRAEGDDQAAERLRGVIEELFGDSDAYDGRWTAVAGDIEAPGLGLGRVRRRELAREVGSIVHSAASVSFSLPLEDSRRINVRGSRRVLGFAKQCDREGGLERFVHVSTAYVAGDHSGVFSEDQLDIGQGFRNSYEQSKFEAERLVRSYAHRFPVQIFRPSIIVGEASSGWTASFNVLYPPLRAFEAGTLPVLPARASTPVDVVPVDYVADAIYELSKQPAERAEVHHLVAGRLATTVGRLAQRTSNYFERRPPRIVDPRAYRLLLHPLLVGLNTGRRRRALRRTEDLFPYFSMRVRFDDRRARARLARAGIDPPSPDGYFDRLLHFAVASRWGKKRMSRADAHRRLAPGATSPNI